MPEAPPTPWSLRHPRLAALIGFVCGLAAGWIIFNALYILRPLVDIPNPRGEGKGGFIVEALWFYCGIPLSGIAGAIWPSTIGRLFLRRRARTDH